MVGDYLNKGKGRPTTIVRKVRLGFFNIREFTDPDYSFWKIIFSRRSDYSIPHNFTPDRKITKDEVEGFYSYVKNNKPIYQIDVPTIA